MLLLFIEFVLFKKLKKFDNKFKKCFNKNMKKYLLVLLLCFALLPCLSINFASASENINYVVVANSATLFESADFSSEKIATLSLKDEVEIEMLENTPVEHLCDGFVFYSAKFEDKTGYILSDMVAPKNECITTIPNFNAKTNASCTVYFKNDVDFVESDIILEKHQQIFLYEGFDDDTEWTAISFLKDNSVVYGYLKTENVAPNGINPIFIVCISVILAAVGIVFAWVFIKNKKVKLKQK